MTKTAKKQLKKNNTKKMKGGFLGRLAGWFSGNNKEEKKNDETDKPPTDETQTEETQTEETQTPSVSEAKTGETPVSTHMGGRRRNTKKATRKAKKGGRIAKKGARKANKSRRTRK